MNRLGKLQKSLEKLCHYIEEKHGIRAKADGESENVSE